MIKTNNRILQLLPALIPACISVSGNSQNTEMIIREFNPVSLEIKEMIKQEEFKNASFGFYAVDISTDDVLVEHNPDLSLIPASVMKTVTTAVALEMLGENYRFSTSVEYDGTIDSAGTLHGNVYIRGGGDPALGSERFKSSYYEPCFLDRWADSIKKRGIDSIAGAIVGDASIYTDEITPPTWIWGDIGNHYGASPCGLSIYDNNYEITYRSGTKNGDTTYIKSIRPEIPGLIVENYVRASDINKDEAYIFGSVYSGERRISGTIPKGKNEFIVKGSVPDPALLAASELNGKLKEEKIGVALPPSTLRKMKTEGKYTGNKRTCVCTTRSPSLKYIVELTNKHSINLYAEHLLYQVGCRKYPQGGTPEGSKAAEAFLESIGIDVHGLYINYGSGLSRYNAITARQITGLLVYMKKKSPAFGVFYGSLPVAGKSGTLKSMLD
ncbi:MAG: D-alanyl-D-alanine carboxypeptidase/D-alanyl-D-alanine-endopeptidase, partial [Bacteroidetes bacterium]|nr:D-alanyl-D-alanine carboxypeptidase/D-alanyl-D-alanine-endopeptidase [Bacteroidota bacterium]